MTTPPTQLHAVCLDAGGVLLLPSPNLVTPLLAAAGVTANRNLLTHAHYAAVHATDQATEHATSPARIPTGGAAPTSYWYEYARACGVPPLHLDDTTEALAAEFARDFGWWCLVPGAREALAALTARYRVAIISNGDGRLEDALRDMRLCQVGPGPGAPVTTIIDSAVVGVAKPDRIIYALAVDRLGVIPAHTIHVGDSLLTDVQGAQAAGIHAYHFDPYQLCAQPAGGHHHLTALRQLTQPA
jgi:putative hydrolase of the HAD superfamily